MKTITMVWTDGLGTYQARCSHCDWRGPWRRKETKAAEDAKQHGAERATLGVCAANPWHPAAPEGL